MLVSFDDGGGAIGRSVRCWCHRGMVIIPLSWWFPNLAPWTKTPRRPHNRLRWPGFLGVVVQNHLETQCWEAMLYLMDFHSICSKVNATMETIPKAFTNDKLPSSNYLIQNDPDS